MRVLFEENLCFTKKYFFITKSWQKRFQRGYNVIDVCRLHHRFSHNPRISFIDVLVFNFNRKSHFLNFNSIQYSEIFNLGVNNLLINFQRFLFSIGFDTTYKMLLRFAQKPINKLIHLFSEF